MQAELQHSYTVFILLQASKTGDAATDVEASLPNDLTMGLYNKEKTVHMQIEHELSSLYYRCSHEISENYVIATSPGSGFVPSVQHSRAIMTIRIPITVMASWNNIPMTASSKPAAVMKGQMLGAVWEV